MKTFSCNFSGGVSCEISVTDAPPPKGSSHIVGVRWTGAPQKRHVRPYLEWAKTVNQQLADEWQARLMHVVQVGRRRWQAWTYEPGGQPALVEEVRV